MRTTLAAFLLCCCVWQSSANHDVRKVHIVWMNHLDVGYTNDITSVMNLYWHQVHLSLSSSPSPSSLNCNVSRKQCTTLILNLISELQYFPQAVATGTAVNVPGKNPQWKYTSHSYLLDLFFDCPPNIGLHCNNKTTHHSSVGAPTPDFHPQCVQCPNSTELETVRQGIKDGVITWHAFPFNAEPELADKALFRWGIAADVCPHLTFISC